MEDPEPSQLKYSTLGAAVVLNGDAATCFAASDKVHALGCRSGAIRVLDFEGHQVQVLREHGAPVTGVAFDSSLEWLASCADDSSIVVRPACAACTCRCQRQPKYPGRPGRVSQSLRPPRVQVRNVYSPDERPWRSQAAAGKRPTCIAVNPWISERQTREVVVGTRSGHVLLIARVRLCLSAASPRLANCALAATRRTSPVHRRTWPATPHAVARASQLWRARLASRTQPHH